MDPLFRFPLNLGDESDSDAEDFVVPNGGSELDLPPVTTGSSHNTSQNGDFSQKKKGSASAAATLTSKVLQPGYEQLDSVPKGGSRFMKKRAARLERAKTSGAGWFNMRAPEMTEEVKQNLEVLQMRSAIDKNRVYKKNDMRVLPKYFQMGTVVESAADFYSGRIPKKQRRKTLVEELMADVEAKKQLKKKAAKAAVKKQLMKQKPFPKKKSSKMRNRDMD